jgi:hypothetical protein
VNDDFSVTHVEVTGNGFESRGTQPLAAVGAGAIIVTDEQKTANVQQLQRTLSNIHAVARHLLNVDEDEDELFVGVQPLGSAWRTEVRYAGFKLITKDNTLSGVLERTLSKLMTNVGRRLDEGTRLLAALNPDPPRDGTRLAVEEAVKRVRGVADVLLQEDEPGAFTVFVKSELKLDSSDRCQLAAEVGVALAHHKPTGAVVRVKIVDPAR